jgi:hypothetical protein
MVTTVDLPIQSSSPVMFRQAQQPPPPAELSSRKCVRAEGTLWVSPAHRVLRKNELRYAGGVTPTSYTYTGQYSDSYINLLWYKLTAL